MSIKELEPKVIWENFYALTQIPRPSKKEKQIIAYMEKFGKDLGLETIVDEIGNVIIRKPATAGMENRQGIILQAHLDMVPQKNSDKVHDFEKDPIEAYVDGEWVRAKGTTLGADNGMGVAAAMAVLQAKDLVHGPIEALFTIDEETGMTGAKNLQPNVLKGSILVNLDSEDEGELYVGCAGGLDGSFTYSFKEEAVPAGHEAYKLSVTGLKGGHSGMDIILYRGNANKIMCRFLKDVAKDLGVRLASIDGGSLRNAIPREAFATITVAKDKADALKKAMEAYYEVVAAEYSIADPDLKMALEATGAPKNIMDEKTVVALLDGVQACPNNVYRMSDAMPGLVETSNNLAIVKSENGKVSVKCLMRSSVDTAKADLASAMESVFRMAGAECEFTGGYNGWKPNMESAILKTMKESYKELYGKEPEVKAIHAGLECGILSEPYPSWDMISIGPTIRSPHSPDERVKIDTVGKFWNFLMAVLKDAPAK